jgi:hypothetical protein
VSFTFSHCYISQPECAGCGKLPQTLNSVWIFGAGCETAIVSGLQGGASNITLKQIH